MSDPGAKSSVVRRAYEDFLAGVMPPADAVRSVVRDSWARSIRQGVDPADSAGTSEAGDPSMSPTEFTEYRDAHPITAVRPLVQSLIPGVHTTTRPRLSQLTFAGEKKLGRLPRRSARAMVVPAALPAINPNRAITASDRGAHALLLFDVWMCQWVFSCAPF